MISNRKKLQETIDRITYSVINEMFMDEKNQSAEQADDNYKKREKEAKKDTERNSKNTKAATRRARVINWLKDDSVNCAEIMRKLWRPESKKEDAARSYFYKCRDGELNDTGVPYSFSDNDINRLYGIMNNLK